MIFESILIIGFAIILDLVVSDPRNRYHPTAWIGALISSLVPLFKNENPVFEKIGGVFVVLIASGIVCSFLVIFSLKIDIIGNDFLVTIITVVVGAILLKTTIAIRGMEKHALAVVNALERDDIEDARVNLAMIVKRHFEIKNFVPSIYFEIKTEYKTTTFTFEKGKIKEKAKADAFLSEIENKPLTIADIKRPHKDYKFIKCDVLKQSDIENAFASGYDYVYNFAAFANLDDANKNPIKTLELNLLANMKIVELCIKNNIKKYIFSSSAYAMSHSNKYKLKL